jgi:hypothetical protein
MPTTIEERSRRKFPFGLPIGGICTALIIWFGGMAVAASFFDPSSVVIFGPQSRTVAAVAQADGSLLRTGPGFTIARSDRAGFVRRLYFAGAWFVWPALSEGCFAADRFRR